MAIDKVVGILLRRCPIDHRAQPFSYSDRTGIGWVDVADEGAQTQATEGPVAQRAGSLGRIAIAFVRLVDLPS